MIDDFAVFIISHGRPECVTYHMIKSKGYAGKIFIVIDDLDETVDEYKNRYGDDVIVLDKMAQFRQCDPMINKEILTSDLYARAACYNLAKEKGVAYFAAFDDDLRDIYYRKKEHGQLKHKKVNDISLLFETAIAFLNVPGVVDVGFGNEADYIGGANSPTFDKGIVRRVFGSHILKTKEKAHFKGVFNADLNAALVDGAVGKMFFSLIPVHARFEGTGGKNAGGMSDLYSANNGYVNAFYTIMCAPSSVKGKCKFDRISANIAWNFAVPKIINERWKKTNAR